MPTLVIHAAAWAVREGRTSFDQIVESRIGDGYAISRTRYPELWANDGRVPLGWTVAVLDKAHKRRAEGRLRDIVADGVTRNGRRRYNVHTGVFHKVDYRPQSLDRCGVTVVHP